MPCVHPSYAYAHQSLYVLTSKVYFLKTLFLLLAVFDVCLDFLCIESELLESTDANLSSYI